MNSCQSRCGRRVRRVLVDGLDVVGTDHRFRRNGEVPVELAFQLLALRHVQIFPNRSRPAFWPEAIVAGVGSTGNRLPRLVELAEEGDARLDIVGGTTVG